MPISTVAWKRLPRDHRGAADGGQLVLGRAQGRGGGPGGRSAGKTAAEAAEALYGGSQGPSLPRTRR